MLNFDPTSSSQNAERQRRLSSEEKSRVNRLADASGVREAQTRAVAEAPAKADIERFRALMGSAEKSTAQDAGNRTKPDGGSRTTGTHASANGQVDSAASESSVTLANRYRSMLLTPDAVDRAAGTHRGDDDAADSARSSSGRPSTATADDARNAATANKPGETPLPQADVDSQGLRTASDGIDASGETADVGTTDEKSAAGEKPREADKGGASKDGDTSAALDRKATAGDTQALVVARKKSDSDDGGSAGAGQHEGSQSLVAMPQGGFNPMAAAPQSGQMANAVQQPIPQAGMITPQLVDLIRNNVKQMLVSDGRSPRGRSREMLLRMQDDTLPGTDLWLTQTDDGWHIRADVSSREGYDTLMANKDDLIQRFAEQALGELSIEPVYHD